MSLVTYSKGSYRAEVDVQKLAEDCFKGTVLLTRPSIPNGTHSRHEVDAVSSSVEEALDEAKALAHRLLDKY